MRASIFLHLDDLTDPPRAIVLGSQSEFGRFISLELSDQATLSMPGREQGCVTATRAIAAALNAAADELEAAITVGAESTADREAAASRTAGDDVAPLLSAPPATAEEPAL